MTGFFFPTWLLIFCTLRVFPALNFATFFTVNLSVNCPGCICSCLVGIVTILWVPAILYVYCFRICCTMCELLYVCVAGFTLDAELLARSQYSEGPATGHLDTGFSWFPCVYKQMLRWLPRFQFATTCFSCSPPNLNLNLSLTSFIFCLHVK